MGTITQKEEASKPSTPSSGYWRLYAKSDGYYMQDGLGVETKIGSSQPPNIHGTEYYDIEDYNPLSISSTTPTTYLSLSTGNLPLGDYKVSFNFNWSYDDVTGNRANINVYENGVAHLPNDIKMETKNPTDIAHIGSFFLLHQRSGVYTLEIKGHCDSTNDTLTFSGAYLEVQRVR